MTAATARRWEHRLYLGAHPLVYPLLTGVGRLAPAVRIPGVGVLVSSATVAREVLADTERFVKNGPGSSGALWTPVLGPSVLLNMEGPEHRLLRAKLAGLFTPAAAQALCQKVLAPVLDDLDARLRRGERVDVVRPTKAAAARVIAELIGFPIPDGGAGAGASTGRRAGDTADRAALELFAAGERIVAMVKLTTRRLSPAQIAEARRVLARLVEPAAAAYRKGDPDTAMGRMADLGLSEQEALGAAAAFFLTGTETVATTVPRLIAALCDYGLDEPYAAFARRSPESPESPDVPHSSDTGSSAAAAATAVPQSGAGTPDHAQSCPERYGPAASRPASADGEGTRSGRPETAEATAAAPTSGRASALAPPWLDQAIDEAMRVMTPTPAMLRSVAAPARVGGVHVRPGDRVIIATLTCTRSTGPFDPTAILTGRRPDPDLKRLWFGAGPHYCIGAPLALAEIRTLTQTVLATGPLRIERRKVAHGVLIPTYRLLEIRAR